MKHPDIDTIIENSFVDHQPAATQGQEKKDGNAR
jgi:hypothetical protein